jgi:hypothetical protein
MTTEPRAPETESPTLHCCQGGPAPDGVVRGWADLLAMRTSAQQGLVDLLASTIVSPDPDAVQPMIARFCDEHGLEPQPVLRALDACQFLLQRSAALDLDSQRFIDDLQALSPEDPAGLRLLASRYLPLKQGIREQLLELSLADHGNVLIGLDWRVDRVASTDRAANLDAPVVYLTLQLRSATEHERVTVQLTNRSIQLLRQFTQRFSDGA